MISPVFVIIYNVKPRFVFETFQQNDSRVADDTNFLIMSCKVSIDKNRPNSNRSKAIKVVFSLAFDIQPNGSALFQIISYLIVGIIKSYRAPITTVKIKVKIRTCHANNYFKTETTRTLLLEVGS